MVAEDVTERRRMLEQFHQAERLGAMARMAGGVAHDFNNLLTVILGSSEVLLRRWPTPTPNGVTTWPPSSGRRAGGRPHQPAAGHRAPAAGSAGGGRPRRRGESMRADDRPRLLGKDVELELVPSPTAAQILADPAELERALLNMAINARDAMPDGGRFAIRTKVMGTAPARIVAGVALMVSDTGVGMDSETAEHCFEPFFTTKGLAQGTGLGLAAVHAMVTQAGGRHHGESPPWARAPPSRCGSRPPRASSNRGGDVDAGSRPRATR